MNSRITFWAFLLASLLLTNSGVSDSLADKNPLDHEVYTIWNKVLDQGISRDGQWAFWEISPEEADGALVVHATSLDPEYRLERGYQAGFSHDSRHLLALVQPTFEETRQARLDDIDEAEKPEAGLTILNLSDGSTGRFERVRSYQLPEKAGGWVAFLHGVEPETEDEADDAGQDESGEDEDNNRADDQEAGTQMVVLSLDNGQRHEFDHVGQYAWAEDGSRLAFTRITPEGDNDGLWVIDPESGREQAVLTGHGKYGTPVFDEEGQQLAFVARLQDEERPEHAHTLYRWSVGDDQARVLADESAEFLASGWHVSEHHQPEFSESGQRLYFGTAPDPVEIPDNDDKLDDEVVKVDIWHWQDDRLQPMQLIQLEEDRKRTWLAVAHLDNDNLIQLATAEIPEVEVTESGDTRYLLGLSDLPYRRRISWDFPGYYDIWRVDADTGEAEKLVTAVQYRPQLSPQGQYIGWWDRDEETWRAIRLSNRQGIDLGQGIGTELADHTNDRPFAANPHAPGHWLADDSIFLIHDRHDIWRVDPHAPRSPAVISQQLGLEQGWNLRLVDLEPDSAGLDVKEALLATAFDEDDKEHGFVRLHLDGQKPEQLIMSGHHYGHPEKAEEADKLQLTRENFHEFPNIWVSDPDFSDMRQLSDINPMQDDYRWGDVSLVSWQSETGKDHQGLLFVPEDLDESRQYPMIVYFYERDSDRFHRHRAPRAHRSVIIPTFYTSNDYVVFVPDVWYREGYPGDSAMESIMPKARELAAEPWIDADRIGIQGHSWAGYQIAYMVTQTDFFRAAAGGAPVSNMTSAYGGIRWRTGLSRMFQYERTQSRLGKTLWEERELYLHNSPLFFADRINTPLLMMHNDNDGAVPWEQGIELFVALRRLGRPAWLINYNDEPHWPTTFANRKDWQIRLQQFFDHYLKDEPAPRWLRAGIPALEKGSTLGYESE